MPGVSTRNYRERESPLACLTAVFTGPPYDIGFQENPDSAAPVQHLLDRESCDCRSDPGSGSSSQVTSSIL
jgi:hypothetical protein